MPKRKSPREVRLSPLDEVRATVGMTGSCLLLAAETGAIDLDRPTERFPKGLRFAVDRLGRALAILDKEFPPLGGA